MPSDSDIEQRDSSDLLTKEIERFEKDCSLQKASIGTLEERGIVLNFLIRNFFKKRTKPSERFVNPQASTREAFLVDIEKKFLASAYRTLSNEDRLVLGAIPGFGESSFRVKKIKYGNHNAMWEVMSAHLYALTGMTCPDARLMKIRDVDEGGISSMCVASPIVPGYQDLGDFLIDGAIRFIKDEDFIKWKEKKSIIERINRAQTGVTTAEDKIIRIKAMEEIYKMLPRYFHNEIEKAYAASKFVANWDFANFNLANIGCKFLLDDDGRVVSLKSIFVDFGNSGAIGFGGKYKEASFLRANSEAKPFAEGAVDYDPSLSFSEAEKSLIINFARKEQLGDDWKSLLDDNELMMALITKIGSELSEGRLKVDEVELAKAILFKSSHHILKKEADIKAHFTTGLLTISDLPRNLPFGFLFKNNIRRKTKEFTDGNQLVFEDSEIEMAYRLSLIPDEAIAEVIKKWNLEESYPQIFAAPQEYDKNDYSTEGLIKIFQERKKYLIDLVPQDLVKKWVAQNKIKAIQAQVDVEFALAQRVGSEFRISQDVVVFNHDFIDDNSDEGLTIVRFSIMAKAIKEEIKVFLEKIKSHECLNKKRESLKNLVEQNESLQTAFMQEQIKFMQTELEQEELQMLVNFLQDNIEKWCKSFDLEPNCNPFDLLKISEIYQARNPDCKKIRTTEFVGSEENRANNLAVFKENSFIYEKFSGILDKLILPSKIIQRCSESALSPSQKKQNLFQ